jgi:hypothetical protein
MALDFVCGWECRINAVSAANVPVETHWQSFVNAPTISTTTVRSGTASGRINPSATTQYWSRTIAQTVVSCRIYLNVATFPTTTQSILAFVNASGTAFVRLGNAGQLYLDMGAASDVAVGSPISTGTWHYLDLLADASTGTAVLKGKLDGGTEAQGSVAQASANFTAARFGPQAATSFDLFFDDLVMGNAAADYPIGPGEVERLLPSADGTHSFTAADFGYDAAGGDVATSATDVYAKLDDSDAMSIADFIRQKVVRSTGYVEVQFADPISGQAPQIVAAVLSMHSSATTANTVGWKWNDNGTIAAISDAAGDGLSDISNTAVAHIYKALTTKPSGGAWTLSAIQGIRVRGGYSTSVASLPYWDGVILEVAFPEAAGVTHDGELLVTGVGTEDFVGVAVRQGDLDVSALATVSLTGSVPGVQEGALAVSAAATFAPTAKMKHAGSWDVDSIASFGATAQTGTGSNFFAGSLDEVVVYGTALSVGEILEHYETGAGLGGRFAASAGVVRTGALAVTGQATVAPITAQVVRTGQLLVTGQATFAPRGAQTQSAQLLTTGLGTYAPIGQRAVAGVWAVPAAATLAPITASIALSGQLLTNALGTLGAIAVRAVPGELLAGALGTFSGTAEALAVHNGELLIAGAGTLAPAGQMVRTGQLLISGQATVAQSAQRAVPGILTISGVGTIALPASIAIPGAWVTTGLATTTLTGSMLIRGAWFIGGGYDETVLASGPKGYWRLGESSGLPQDSSGGGHHVTSVAGTPTYSVPGPLAGDADTAIGFDGTSEYLDVDPAVELHPGNTFSIEAWFRQAATGSGVDRTIWWSAIGEPVLLLGVDDKVYFGIDGVGVLLASTLAITDTAWHHVVVTKQGSTRAMYLDGVDVGFDGANLTVTPTLSDILIGAKG